MSISDPEWMEGLIAIVTDENLTKDERSDKLLPLIREFLDEAYEHGLTTDEAMNAWNALMVSIVEDHNLARN